MPSDLRDDFKSGDPLSHQTMNAIVRALRPTSVRTGGGIDSRRGPNGQTQVNVIQKTAFVGVANGNISARVSAAAGTGSVTRYELDFSGNYATSGVNYDVYNPSSTKMTSGNGIDSGQYCWVQEDDDGNLIVTPLECS